MTNPVADIMHSVSCLIHDTCQNVPHDIGIKVLQLIADKYHTHIGSGGQPDTPRYTRRDVEAFVAIAMAVRDMKDARK